MLYSSLLASGGGGGGGVAVVEGGVGVFHLRDEAGDVLLEEGVHAARACKIGWMDGWMDG